jgi:4a-hydroxytetrahydrobiopterin dehydratase
MARRSRTLRASFPNGASSSSITLEKTYLLPDFKTALEFVNRIGAMAELEGHYADLCFGWGQREGEHLHDTRSVA